MPNQLREASTVRQIHEMDNKNFEKTAEHLEYAALLPDDLHGEYNRLRLFIEDKLRTARPQDRLASMLYAFCQKHLVVATTSLLRGYLSSSARETRAALETAGIAHYILKDGEAYSIFLEYSDGKKGEKAYRNKFGASNILSPDDPDVKDLRRQYDVASTLSHLNPRTVIQHLSPTGRPDQYAVCTQDLRPEELGTVLMWTCQVHWKILHLGQSTFKNLADFTEFKLKLNQVGERIIRFGKQQQEILQVVRERSKPLVFDGPSNDDY
jgi:hypothetical protein